MSKPVSIFLLCCVGSLIGCGGGNEANAPARSNSLNTVQSVLPFFNSDVQVTQGADPLSLDLQLASLLDGLPAGKSLTGNPADGLIPVSIDSPLAQLGMNLFYSKSLGGATDSACVTCHHPVLGGGDNLSLGVGVHAVEPDVLGPGRLHLSGVATVPRNAPTTFNTALYKRSLFWDSRVTQHDGGIRTPDTAFGLIDPDAGDSLLTAQARFPVTSAEEMKTEEFEHGSGNQGVRQHLAQRIGGYGNYTGLNSNWVTQFQSAFNSSESAQTLVTYDNIARALAAYQASQVFIDNPWNQYLAGNTAAISDTAKRGALLFYTTKENGGGDCFRCHEGDHFSDESHHVVAFPQIGSGKGDGATGDDDFARQRETGDQRDRYKFRTPSLLNIEVTAPYGHAGAYRTLREVVNHYNQPSNAISYFDNNNWCRQIAPGSSQACNTLYPNARSNTQLAQQVLENQQSSESIDAIDLTNAEVDQIVEFLETLTDPCTQNRNCLTPWIPPATGGPDGNQLNAVDQFGNRL